MAECRIRLISEDDDYNEEKPFINNKKFPRYGSSNRSDLSIHDNLPEYYIEHQVKSNDTLNSVALKYGSKVCLNFFFK